MSNDNFTEVTSQGWFSRLGGAIKGILFGLILFVVAFPLIFWNEGRAVERIKTLEEGSGAVVHIESSSVRSENNRKLVHLSAKANTTEILEDPIFKVKKNAIKLRRTVEIFQWEENVKTKKEKELGGSEKTTKEYSYKKVWSSRLIRSDNFKQTQYRNPNTAPFTSTTLQASNVSFDAFELPRSLIARMNKYKALEIRANSVPTIQGVGPVTAHAGGYYIGNNAAAPEIGDIRVEFHVVEPSLISIVAQQVENTFEPYLTSAGGEIMLLEHGVVSEQGMFKSARDSNTALTWALRIIALLVMFFGLAMILRPLSVLADVVPIFGNIVEAGTSLIAFLIAFVLSVITIAIAWLAFRPLLGGALLMVAAAAIWTLKSKVKRPEAESVALDKP